MKAFDSISRFVFQTIPKPKIFSIKPEAGTEL
jgi:hypothetical protein